MVAEVQVYAPWNHPAPPRRGCDREYLEHRIVPCGACAGGEGEARGGRPREPASRTMVLASIRPSAWSRGAGIGAPHLLRAQEFGRDGSLRGTRLRGQAPPLRLEGRNPAPGLSVPPPPISKPDDEPGE